MRKRIEQKKRTILIASLSFLCVLSAAFTAVFGLIGLKVSKTVILDKYETTSEIKYDIVLLNNPVYNRTELELGPYYITKFVDKINLTFLYAFDCENAENISGSYDVIAEIDAVNNSSNSIWQKKYTFVEKTDFFSSRAVASLSIPLEKYRDLVIGLDTSTGIKTEAKMTIIYTANVSAIVRGIPVSETSVSTLSFNLNQDLISIGGSPLSEQTKNVTKRIAQDMMSQKTALCVFIPFFVLFAASNAYILLFTRGFSRSPEQTELDGILKKYGGRIIELYSMDRLRGYETITVNTFRDLILVADELKRPVLKKNRTIPKKLRSTSSILISNMSTPSAPRSVRRLSVNIYLIKLNSAPIIWSGHFLCWHTFFNMRVALICSIHL